MKMIDEFVIPRLDRGIQRPRETLKDWIPAPAPDLIRGQPEVFLFLILSGFPGQAGE
jgi:hypothetical protein